MEQTAEQAYTELLRQLANPAAAQPEVLADRFRQIERMHASGQIEDWQMQNAREAYATTGSPHGSKVGDAADWIMHKARSGAEQARERAVAGVSTYTNEDPVRAMLIAAGVGALLMGLVAMTVRSGVRSVRRRIRA